MTMSNAMRDTMLNMVFEGVDPPWRPAATGYLALITGASIDLDDPMLNECTYPGYARIAGTKASVFAGSGTTRTNAALLQWGKRTDAGAVQTARYVVWCDTASGAVTGLTVIGTIDGAGIDIAQNSKPQAEPGDIIWTAL